MSRVSLISLFKTLKILLVELPGRVMSLPGKFSKFLIFYQRLFTLNYRGALFFIAAVPSEVVKKLGGDFQATLVDWLGDEPQVLWRELSLRLSVLLVEVGDACLAWSVKQKENFSFVESFKLLYREEFERLLIGVPCAMALLDWAVTKHALRGVLIERVLLVVLAIIVAYGLLLVLRLLLLGLLVTRRVLNLSGRSLLRGAKILGGHAVSIAKRARKERQEKTDLFLKSKKLAQVCFLLLIWPIVPEVNFVSLTLKVVHWALKGWVI